MITLVTTVLNDLAGTQSFLRQMACQTRPPDEIVVVDAGSRDGTWEFLQRAAAESHGRLVALQERGCNIARGRNLAIEAARFDVIVSTDVGCEWEPQWLEELVEPLLRDPGCEAVMGSWRVQWSDQRTLWAQVDPLLRGGLKFIATDKAHASSRAIAYRKDLWQRIGKYPEDLTLAADDLVFVLLLHKQAHKTAAALQPRCVWKRPQRLKQILREARRNFQGSGEALIFLDYFCLVGGRIALEWVVLAGALLALASGGPSPLLVGLGAAALVLLAWRLKSWLWHLGVLRSRGSMASLWHVAALDYATRLWGLLGYWEGLRHGAGRCPECRRRLRAAGIGWW
jgi:glycosyltransferase involved in cell wall biosynthesis